MEVIYDARCCVLCIYMQGKAIALLHFAFMSDVKGKWEIPES